MAQLRMHTRTAETLLISCVGYIIFLTHNFAIIFLNSKYITALHLGLQEYLMNNRDK